MSLIENGFVKSMVGHYYSRSLFTKSATIEMGVLNADNKYYCSVHTYLFTPENDIAFVVRAQHECYTEAEAVAWCMDTVEIK